MTATCDRCEALTLAFAEFLNPRPRPVIPAEPEPADIYDYLGDRTTVDPRFETSVAALHADYIRWSHDHGRLPLGKNRFGRVLDALGFPAFRGTAGIRMRRGLRLT